MPLTEAISPMHCRLLFVANSALTEDSFNIFALFYNPGTYEYIA